MERFYLTVARVAKQALHHMVEHRIPMLPDIYSRHFYNFLAACDQDSQHLIAEQLESDSKESDNQQQQSLSIMLELTEMINKLDQITGNHCENLDNHLLKLKETEEIDDLNKLKNEITNELGQVIISNNEIHKNILDAKTTVERLHTKMEEVADMATIDDLTGLYNRRALFSRLTEEFSRARRYEQSFSILLIDIDDFKKINDEHGHLVGDGILRGLGAFLRQNLRDSDFPARYGGEEFICLLPSADLTQASLAGEKIREHLATSKLRSKKMGVSLQITVSIGVATLSEDEDENIDSLIKRADKALYQAKRNGKNQLVNESEIETAT